MIRTAVIGLGWVGSHRHVPTIARLREYELVGLIDARPMRAESLKRRFAARHALESSSLSGAPWLDEIDLVVVATEPARHAPLVLEALAAGKHVLTEKPFAMSVAEGEQLVDGAMSAGRTLSVVHNFQFSRSVQKLERDLAVGRLGEVKGLWGCQLGNPGRRLPEWYPTLPMGLFYDESPHLLYLLRKFGGHALSLVSRDIGPIDERTNTPATVFARLEAQSGHGTIPAVLSMFFDSPISEWHFAILGDDAIGVVDIFRDIYYRIPNDGRHDAASILRTSSTVTWQHWVRFFSSGLRLVTGRLAYGNDVLYGQLAKALPSGKSPAGISSQDALAVLRLQHAILEGPLAR